MASQFLAPYCSPKANAALTSATIEKCYWLMKSYGMYSFVFSFFCLISCWWDSVMLLPVFVVSYFSSLSSILLYDYPSIYWWVLGLFLNFVSIFWYIYIRICVGCIPGSGINGQGGHTSSFRRHFQSILQFANSSAGYENSRCSMASSTLGIVSFYF